MLRYYINFLVCQINGIYRVFCNSPNRIAVYSTNNYAFINESLVISVFGEVSLGMVAFAFDSEAKLCF